MNVVTIGLSPYVLSSHAKIHSEILKFLYFNNHSVAGIVWGHDEDYFLPKENNKGEKKFYYDFDDHSIPLVPFNPLKDPSVAVYEILESHQPDMLITIGDYNDFLYMKAVKMFSNKSFKWLAVLANHTYPINEQHVELSEEMDAIMCINHSSYNMMKKIFKKDEISYAYIGCPDLSLQIKERDFIRKERKISNQFRVMNCGKNIQADNIPMAMEACVNMRDEIPNIQLYVHTNIHDKGEFDLKLIQERLDPNAEFIVFPDKYVSLIDGYDEKQFQTELAISDILVMPSFNASSGLMGFEAISCGCLPLMPDIGCCREIAEIISDLLPEFEKNDFLIPCIEILVAGEVYMNICNPKELRKKIINLHNKKNKKGGMGSFYQEFVRRYHRKDFFKELNAMIKTTKRTNPTLCVESV